ncbi:MAG: hypothetical protein E6J90_33075 [Deltaproteobacteria bacterium]|nr:MAG: hypothetical protein E6J90_33075 [Deltaproteobacteria bacterium]TMQ18023.1 MAG: hypothetical protein E6J91_08875 [Deltaproteobacteria bacterium]
MTVVIVDADGKQHVARIAETGAYVTIAACPSCHAAQPQIRGTGITHHDHDTYYARAVARCCSAALRMETRVDTIFGIEEDERVLHGRPRVY